MMIEASVRLVLVLAVVLTAPTLYAGETIDPARLTRDELLAMPHLQLDAVLTNHLRHLAMRNIVDFDGQTIVASDVTVDQWLHDQLGDGTTVDWEVNDCGEGGRGPGESYPLCVVAEAFQENDCPLMHTSFMVMGSEGALGARATYWLGNYSAYGVKGRLEKLPELREQWQQLVAHQQKFTATLSSQNLTPGQILGYANALLASKLADGLPQTAWTKWVQQLLGNHYLDADVPKRYKALWRECRLHPMWVDYKASLSHGVSMKIALHLGTWQQGITGKPRMNVTFFRSGEITSDKQLYGDEVAQLPEVLAKYLEE